MRPLILLLLALFLGACTEKPVPVKPETHPVRQYKPKRMVCSEPNKQIRVAIIDTGFISTPLSKDAKLCNTGHKNFSNNKDMARVKKVDDLVPLDNYGHGTNIAGLIQKYANDVDFCMVIIKLFDPTDTSTNYVEREIQAIKYATQIKADYINFSGGGTGFDIDEQKAVKAFLDQGGKFIAAAGNEKSDIDQPRNRYYPAMSDPRVIVVGNAEPVMYEQDSSDKKTVYVDNQAATVVASSNYGYRVNRWEYGTDQFGFGVKMTGTSQSTAIATGKIISKNKPCN